MYDENLLVRSVTYIETDVMNEALEAVAAYLDKRGAPFLDGMVMLRIHRTRRKVTASELRRHFTRRGLELFARLDSSIAELPAVRACLDAPYYKDSAEVK